MKVLLITFSGTGHTTLCGDFIKSHFEQLGHTCDHYVIKHDVTFNYDINEYDLVGFGYPIHAFNAPQAFVRFIKSLPKLSSKKKYFIYKVSGEPFAPNNASSYHSYLKLKRRNFELYAEKHFLMPYNIMFRYKDSLAKQMYLYTMAMCKMIAKKIMLGKEEKPKYNPFTRFFAMLLRIEWVCSWAVGPFYHVKKDKCTNCHSCVKRCPASNIRVTEKGIKFGVHCTTCMRCVFECPQDAIRPGILNPWRVN